MNVEFDGEELTVMHVTYDIDDRQLIAHVEPEEIHPDAVRGVLDNYERRGCIWDEFFDDPRDP